MISILSEIPLILTLMVPQVMEMQPRYRNQVLYILVTAEQLSV